ncbi:hypothetical protein N7471_009134 [Penicillium samsonianum]|uniref:uncharacterized protein n=1 Tax=Penicillium samsonianum TaxID=1882272 RepID=UPI00254961E7|nr:uncharacterized protein N7471_009134 [Penicillium samsonianum]KAJ6127917.1 hypothetical protein N7471_009134 [Penicillium samsonianum]
MTAQVSFFKLPLELLEMIFQHLRQSPHSLSSLALTCRQFHAVTTPALYSSICLRNTLSSEQLARTLQQNFSLSSLVLELQVHFHNTQMDPTYESLLDAICEMHNLERLSVRSIPLQDIFESTNHRLLTMLGTNKNNVEIESPTQYAGQRLRSLYLGAAFTDRDEDKWVLGCNEIVFYMEQLEKLHIQGADIESLHPKHFAASLPSKKTELKELALLNCELSPDTLGRILAFPESFTHFTMKGTCLDFYERDEEEIEVDWENEIGSLRELGVELSIVFHHGPSFSMSENDNWPCECWIYDLTVPEL